MGTVGDGLIPLLLLFLIFILFMCIHVTCACADGISQQREEHGDVVYEGGPQVGVRVNSGQNMGRKCGKWSLERDQVTEKLPLEESENSPGPHRRNRCTYMHMTHTWRAHP